jgi:hypothetical protein
LIEIDDIITAVLENGLSDQIQSFCAKKVEKKEDGD